jgi:hypothetical protein
MSIPSGVSFAGLAGIILIVYLCYSSKIHKMGTSKYYIETIDKKAYLYLYIRQNKLPLDIIFIQSKYLLHL